MEKIEKISMILLLIALIIMIFGLSIICFAQKDIWLNTYNGMIVFVAGMFVGIFSTVIITRNN